MLQLTVTISCQYLQQLFLLFSYRKEENNNKNNDSLWNAKAKAALPSNTLCPVPVWLWPSTTETVECLNRIKKSAERMESSLRADLGGWPELPPVVPEGLPGYFPLGQKKQSKAEVTWPPWTVMLNGNIAPSWDRRSRLWCLGSEALIWSCEYNLIQKYRMFLCLRAEGIQPPTMNSTACLRKSLLSHEWSPAHTCIFPRRKHATVHYSSPSGGSPHPGWMCPVAPLAHYMCGPRASCSRKILTPRATGS